MMTQAEERRLLFHMTDHDVFASPAVPLSKDEAQMILDRVGYEMGILHELLMHMAMTVQLLNGTHEELKPVIRTKTQTSSKVDNQGGQSR